ncbi:MAG: DUF881 domain-containing protein, partial [Actinomycetes bacterium]
MSPQRPEAVPDDGTTAAAWAKVRAGLRPRATAGQVVLAVLFATLGFALVTQVRSAQGADALASARPDDLVRILDGLQERQARLQTEADQLQATETELLGGADQAGAALQRAKEQAQSLGILAGTVPATGEGITLTVVDSQGTVDAPLMLDAVQELRDAGAEAIQIDGRRVVASTAIVDTPAGIAVDGVTVASPYEFVVIGDSETLSSSLSIPGGIVESVRNLGGEAVVVRHTSVDVTALKPLVPP